jgi:heme-degrading monooxygenase HmoA
MILEAAVFNIKEGTQADFEKSFGQAQLIISKANGYISHQLQNCLENNKRYLLLVQWRTLEDHMEGFRKSEDFLKWRALIGPYFDTPPAVEHYELKFYM